MRKESRAQFAICITIAVILLGISTALFASPSMLISLFLYMWQLVERRDLVYRYIFLTWPFFTTVTCTAYIFLVATTVFSIVCRLNFGKGLAHYCK